MECRTAFDYCDSIRRSPSSDSLFYCTIDGCDLISPFHRPDEFLSHLFNQHQVTIKEPRIVIPYLQKYIEHYTFIINRGEPVTLGDIDVANVDKNNAINPHSDQDVRRFLQQEKLSLILRIQERERSVDHVKSRKCLFCTKHLANKYQLFIHMFELHGFNIGLLDNLVEVEEFLTILEGKLLRLECIYCEKLFTSASVLRKHMRKKKHFRIHSKNHFYDKYYVINFVEPGKSWQELDQEKSKKSSYSVQRLNLNEHTRNDTDSTRDFFLFSSSDDEILHEKTICLFDDHIADSPQEIVDHLVEAHHFDLKVLSTLHSLSLYDRIKFVNNIRTLSADYTCFVCDESFDNCKMLNDHIGDKSIGHCMMLPLSEEWKNDRYLISPLGYDPLLTMLDDL